MKKVRNILISLFVLAAFILAAFFISPKRLLAPITERSTETNTNGEPKKPTNKNLKITSTANTVTTERESLPSSSKLNVPFYVQAPFGNWDPLHEDACEEASLLMVYYYENKLAMIDSEELDIRIKELIGFEEAHNYGPSVTLKELIEIAKSNLPKLKGARLISNPSIETIMKEIANDNPVIIPAAGKLLKNPNFKNGGPDYHMLVIIGYTKTEFITNDPGTKNGQDYHYPHAVIMDAIHDWDSSDIQNGARMILVYD